ncbi:MAG: hypothetical protein ACFCUU_01275 [Cyclobacteriaceae bacterium]
MTEPRTISNPSPEEQRNLLLKIIEGDEQAYGELYNKFFGTLVNYGRRFDANQQIT